MSAGAVMETTRAKHPGRAWFTPPLGFLLFLLYPVHSLMSPLVPIRDPGIGWHLVMGHRILEEWEIPIADAFSFTATGTEWVSFYWLFQVCAAALEKLGGLPLFTAATVLVYALVPVLLYRRMVRIGVGTLMALLFGALAYNVFQGHALARPHVFTYVFFALLLEQLDRVQNSDAPPRSLTWLPLLALLWCNLHAGFVVGLVLTGLYAGVAGVRYLLTGDAEEKGRASAFSLALLAMSAATLVNPAGPWLHLSILEYLGSESMSHFDEWTSPRFTSGVHSLVLQGVILSLPLLMAMRARLSWVEAIVVAFFLGAGLRSVRHVNLFVIVAIPIVARELVRASERVRPALGRILARAKERKPLRRAILLWYGSFCSAFLALAGLGMLSYRSNLDDVWLSADAAAYIEEHLQQFERPFNTDDMGGALIYRFWPALHVFMDDRTPVYGDHFIIEEYEPVLRAKPGWEAVLNRWGVRSAVVRADTPAAMLLDASPTWESVHRDDKTALFVRLGPPPDATAAAGRATGLAEPTSARRPALLHQQYESSRR